MKTLGTDLRSISKGEEGQATLEYIMILAILVGIFVTALAQIREMDLAGKMTGLITREFAAAYQYGHPEAKGPGNGGPEMHPRYIGGKNFRIFINPGSR